MKRLRLFIAAVALMAASGVGVSLHAEIKPDDQKKLEAVEQSLQQVVVLFRSKKYQELGTLIDDIERQINELKESPSKDELAGTLPTLETKLSAAKTLLASSLPAPAAKPAAPARPANPNRPMPQRPGSAPAAGGISFTQQVAPILVGKCGRCHVQRSSGGFNVGSYAALMRGSDAGTVFRPGMGAGSRLIEVLETGDMPRGGNKLSADEITTITKWIDAGARFDGTDPNAMLAGAAPGGGQPGEGAVARPTGNETVSFMKDIAPVIVGRCTKCHGGERPADNMGLETFTQIMRGGRTGDIVNAGNPGSSLIIQMIKGIAKDQSGARPRMPQRETPLTDDIIKKFETWIAEGAKFDGDNPGQSLDFQLRVIKARGMTHAQLASHRAELAKGTWALGNPDTKTEVEEGGDFHLVGNIAPARMAEVLTMAEAERTKVASFLKIPSGQPMIKGKLTIFLFNRRYEYSEFGRMVERRTVPPEVSGHFHYNVVDCYAAVMAPQDGDVNFPLVLAEQFAGAYVDNLGQNVPRWFTVGTGRMVASRVEPKCPLIKQWDEGVLAAVAEGGKMDAFLNAKELDARGSSLAYGLVKFMSRAGGKHQQLIDAMRKGAPFDRALQQIYGTNAAGLLAVFAKSG